jgi:hypothetical protein
MCCAVVKGYLIKLLTGYNSKTFCEEWMGVKEKR